MLSEMYRDVRKKILVAMILVPLIPFLASLAIGYTSYRNSMKRASMELAERIARDHALLIEAFLNERRTDLDVILSTADAADLTGRVRLRMILDALRHASLTFIDLGLIDEEGIQQAYAGPHDLKGKNYAHMPWFHETLEKGSFVSDVYMGYRNKPHFVVAVAVSRQGRKWILRATVDQALFGDLVEGVSIGGTGEAYIVNNDGLLQTDRRSGGVVLANDDRLTPVLKVLMPLSKSKAATYGEYLYAAAPLNNGKWTLIVTQRLDEALRDINRAVLYVALVCLVGGAFIVGLAFTISNRVVTMLRTKEQARREMETHLMRAAKLAELGEMSAGFAHEINNPLQIMTSEIALMQMEVDDAGGVACGGSAVRQAVVEGLEQLRKQIERCASITRSILNFGRYAGPETSRLDLSKFLPDLCSMVQRKARVSGIEFSCNVQESVPRIQADPGQLQQVILNLMNNAIQAIADRHNGEGGRLSVSAVPYDGRVDIIVEDNGSGIAPDNLERIFNPFFTTKPPGKGTGLGLSVCHAIIDAMGGSINVTSQPGHGTTFVISLPKAG